MTSNQTVAPIHATHIGTATLLLEIGEVRLLTDPVFDAPGITYAFGFGTKSVHTETPALTPTEVGPVDAVLLSHDQHGDNFDNAGRAYTMQAPHLITTEAAHRRLRHPSSVGLKPFESTTLKGLTIHATPARHGPPGSLPIVGHVVGFLIKAPHLPGPIYISGDTVWFHGVREVARRYRPAISFLHMGGVRFPISGALRYTFNAAEAARAAESLGSPLIVPLHYEGWTHFRESKSRAQEVFEERKLSPRVRWLPRGIRTTLL